MEEYETFKEHVKNWARSNPTTSQFNHAGYRRIVEQFDCSEYFARQVVQELEQEEQDILDSLEEVQSDPQRELIDHYCKIVRQNLPSESPPLSRFVDILVEFQKDLDKRDRKQDLVRCFIETKKPVLLLLRADWHLGNVNTDHRRFREDNELIQARPWVKTIEGGDFVEGAVLAQMMDLLHEQIAPVKMQRMILWEVVEKQKDHIIALLQGQHDTWSKNTADFNPIEWLADNTKLPYLGWGGNIELIVGDQLWKITARHNYRFNSSENDSHSPKKLMRMGDSEPGDITIVCDKHRVNYEEFQMMGKMRIAMRPGSYKPIDSYMEKHGFNKSLPYMPGIILWPDQREWIGHYNFRTLLPLIDSMQKE